LVSRQPGPIDGYATLPVQLLLVSLCEVTVREFSATTRSIYIVVAERDSARIKYRLHLVHDDFECAPICPARMAEVPGRASRHQQTPFSETYSIIKIEGSFHWQYGWESGNLLCRGIWIHSDLW